MRDFQYSRSFLSNRNKKFAVVIGVIAGIVHFVIFSLKSGIIVGAIVGIVAGIIVGGSIAIVIRHMAEGKSEKAPFTETLIFHLSHDEVYALCEKALSSVQKHKVRVRDFAQGKLIAKLGMTWTSTGEVITFQLRRNDTGSMLVDITSTPIISSQVYNYESTEKIVSYLRQFSG